MRTLSVSVAPALVLLVAMTPACHSARPIQSSDSAPAVACLLYEDPSIVAEVRGADGKPAALGAKLSVLRGDRVLFSSEEGDSSHSVAYGRATGLVDIQVTKPWFAPVVIKGIRMNTDACGHGTIGLGATLNLLPGAPPVRQLFVPHSGLSLDAGISFRLRAYVDAAPGVSVETTWLSRNPKIASAAQDGTVTGACISKRDSVWVVTSSVANPNAKDSTNVTVWPSSHSEKCRPSGVRPPDVRGVVAAIIDGYGVRDASGAHAIRYPQMQIELSPSTSASNTVSDIKMIAWNASTRFSRTSGQEVGSEQLKVGRIVSVWMTKPVADTSRNQLTATDVVIEKE